MALPNQCKPSSAAPVVSMVRLCRVDQAQHLARAPPMCSTFPAKPSPRQVPWSLARGPATNLCRETSRPALQLMPDKHHAARMTACLPRLIPSHRVPARCGRRNTPAGLGPSCSRPYLFPMLLVARWRVSLFFPCPGSCHSRIRTRRLLRGYSVRLSCPAAMLFMLFLAFPSSEIPFPTINPPPSFTLLTGMTWSPSRISCY